MPPLASNPSVNLRATAICSGLARVAWSNSRVIVSSKRITLKLSSGRRVPSAWSKLCLAAAIDSPDIEPLLSITKIISRGASLPGSTLACGVIVAMT